MNCSRKSFYLAVLAAAFGTATTTYADGITDAVKNGEAHLSFRLRYEDVEVQPAAGASSEGKALTLKTRLNYKTAAYHGLTAFVEMDDVSAYGYDQYNDSLSNPAQPQIADPEGTEVNQAWVAYKKFDTEVKYGRQVITLDNHRFVGHVGWRQNMQTYDGLSVKNTSVSGLELSAIYIANVNRIFGEAHPVGDVDMDTYLFNAGYKAGALGKFSAYAYLLDSDELAPAGLAAWDTDTYGLRWTNAVDSGAGKFSYALEYARQSDARDNPRSYDAEYFLVEAGLAMQSLSVDVGYEQLGADGTAGQFITPLATLFKFQGWTDQFINGGLGNILEGVVDVYASISGTFGGVKLAVVYHDFSSDESNPAGDDDIGSEWGVIVAKKFGAYGVELRHADFEADSASGFNGGGLVFSDTTKTWLTFTADF